MEEQTAEDNIKVKETEMRPCPFCGGKVEPLPEKEWDESITWGAYCNGDPDCFINSTNAHYETRDELIEAWNKRAKQV